MILNRKIESEVEKSLSLNPVTAVLGARQTRKTTLIKQLAFEFKDVRYLDLEKPPGKNLLTDAEFFFSMNKNKPICLDEIQRVQFDFVPLLII